jgi:hypothetical protein
MTLGLNDGPIIGLSLGSMLIEGIELGIELSETTGLSVGLLLGI